MDVSRALSVGRGGRRFADLTWPPRGSARIRYRTLRQDNQYCGIDSLYIFLNAQGFTSEPLVNMEKNLPPKSQGISVLDAVRYCEDQGVLVSAVKTFLSHLVDEQ